MLSGDPSVTIESLKNLQTDNTASGWLKTACYLASNGKMVEAERAIKMALQIEDQYPIGWTILAAILLSSGRETDAEQAGKKAIEQCKNLRMSWPKLRSLIRSEAIKKGSEWKNPKRVVIDVIPNNEWGNVLQILSEISRQDIDDITTFEKEKDAEDHQEEELSTGSEDLKTKSIAEPKPEQSHKSSRITSSTRERAESNVSSMPSPSRPRDTSSARTWFSAAETHLRRRKYDEAERAFRKALEFDPLNGEGWFRLGALLFQQENYFEAEKALRRAITQIPGNENAWYLFGASLQKLQRWQEAIMPLKNAININDKNDDYWMKLGLSQYNVGQYKEAEKCFMKTLRITPSHRDATFYLAQCMEIQGNRDHAFTLYNQLLKVGEQRPEVLEKMAGAFERLGAADRAREARRKAAFSRGHLSEAK